MMLTAGLAYDANLPTQGLVARFHEIDVLVDRHDFISITDNREDGDLCFGNRSEVVHWVLVIGERLFYRKPINFQQRLPIALGAGADTLAARPALEVADRRVHIEPGDAVGVKRGPVEGEETTPAETFKHGLLRESVSAGYMGIKLFHVLHGDRGPIHVLHIYVGDMKTTAQQRDVCLRLDRKSTRL